MSNKELPSASSPMSLPELEEALRGETERMVNLKQTIDKNTAERSQFKNSISNYKRQEKFFRDKLNQLDMNAMEQSHERLKLEADKLVCKRNELARLKRSLAEFGQFEPTNEALRREIDELKKSRLSLELTFIS